eukprot:scaffold156806_cov48-Prasinocladus_malaysianus.AAC.2
MIKQHKCSDRQIPSCKAGDKRKRPHVNVITKHNHYDTPTSRAEVIYGVYEPWLGEVGCAVDVRLADPFTGGDTLRWNTRPYMLK